MLAPPASLSISDILRGSIFPRYCYMYVKFSLLTLFRTIPTLTSKACFFFFFSMHHVISISAKKKGLFLFYLNFEQCLQKFEIEIEKFTLLKSFSMTFSVYKSKQKVSMITGKLGKWNPPNYFYGMGCARHAADTPPINILYFLLLQLFRRIIIFYYYC